MATFSQIKKSLSSLINNEVKHSIFLWGAPGIGKSSVVREVAADKNLNIIDLRVSQLAPTDIRGLPFVENGLAKFAPPSFLPQDPDSEGILFIDEFNMASPSMMGIAQQLILDRQVGDYTVPEGWYIIGAGNRVEDRAAVNNMPAPVANRFIHFQVEHDFPGWKEFAYKNGVDEQIISFLNFRPELFFRFEKNSHTWPSPRSWEFANSLHKSGLSIEHAVGPGVAGEFNTYLSIYSHLPDIEAILNGEKVKVPHEPSLLYACIGALTSRSKTADHLYNGLKWFLDDKEVSEDYIGVLMEDIVRYMRTKNLQTQFIKKISTDTKVKSFFKKYNDLMS
jgi:hypothetical protein